MSQEDGAESDGSHHSQDSSHHSQTDSQGSRNTSHADSSSESDDMTKGEKLSPYFLSTSDKSGDKLIVVELKGDNYDEWAVKMRGALRSKKKTGFIDGTIKRPADDSDDLEDWYMVNAMIVNWIFNTIEPSLGSMISYVEEAKELWDDIEQRYSVGNGPKLHRIKGAIHDCKQGNEESVTDYYGRLKRLWDDLDKYDRNPTCNCGGCKCGLNQKLDKKRDEGKLHDFLLGIDSSYSTVASNLLLQEPLPSLNRAYSTMIQEEGVKGKTTRVIGSRSSENRAEPIGFAARYTPPVATRNGEVNDKQAESQRPYCDNCNKYGHVIASCFDIIGYPKGWRDRNRGGGRGGRGSRGGRGISGFGQGRGNANASGNSNAHVSRVSEEAGESKEQYVNVPKEQWDAYVNSAKASSSKARMNGPHNEEDDWYE